MTRTSVVLGSLALGLALAGCGGSGEDAPDAKATEVPRSVAAAPMATGAVESEFGTPVKDRVATLGLLNKRNNLIQDVVLKSGESRRIGNRRGVEAAGQQDLVDQAVELGDVAAKLVA